MDQKITALEAQLNDFSLDTRTAALQELIALVEQGTIEFPPPDDIANMHCHTFFSFNGYGHSPTSLAWLGRRRGFKLMGIVDFDVLDAVDEFLAACDVVGLRGSAGIETRVHFPEFATRETNSPGEPGVTYHIGIGFTGSTPPEPVQPILADMRQRAEQRNRGMVGRVNAYLNPVTVDYDRDVLPLTPNGNATERHMLAAYVEAARRSVPDQAAFWAEKLQMSVDQVSKLSGNLPGFKNTIRSKLMKRGGVGYVQPGPDSFPSMDEVNRLILACGALPCAGWLDGLADGEAAAEEWLSMHLAKGSVAVNIVPDRNWNIADPELKRIKLQKLYEIVELAQKLDLPLNIGTEMNAYGQKLVDDFDAPELAPLVESFMDGAFFVYGHTVAQRALGRGYQSDWANTHLPTRRERNEFYTKLGRQVEPGPLDVTHIETVVDRLVDSL